MGRSGLMGLDDFQRSFLLKDCSTVRFFLSAILIAAVFAPFSRADEAISFRRDIAPLLQRRCATCHCEENAKGKYRLDTYSRLQKAGDSDSTPIVAGKPEESELYQRLVETDATDRMPQKADALPAEEISKIERWIKAGARYDGDSPEQQMAELARESLLHPAPARYHRPAPVAALAFSPDGSQIAVGGYYEVTLWTVSDGSLVRRLGGLPERISSLAWNEKTNVLAVAGGTPGQWGTVALVDPTGNAAPKFLCDETETALCVAFSPGGSMLAAAGGDRTLRLFDSSAGKELRAIRQHADWVQTAAFDKTGTRLVTASRDRTSRIFDVQTGEVQTTYTGHDQPLLEALFSGDGTKVFSLDRNKVIQMWDSHSREKVSELKVPDTDIRHMLLWDRNIVITGTTPEIAIYQLSDRQRLFTLEGHHDSIQALAVSPSRQILASGGADGEVLIWDLACGTWVTRFKASPGW